MQEASKVQDRKIICLIISFTQEDKNYIAIKFNYRLTTTCTTVP